MTATLTISSPLIWRNRPRMSNTLSGWAFQFRRARRSTENRKKPKNDLSWIGSERTWRRACKGVNITILCEFGGAEYCGDPERFFGASLEGQVGRQVGAAVEVFLTAWQTQVQALVTEGGVFITLEDGYQRVTEDSLRFGDIWLAFILGGEVARECSCPVMAPKNILTSFLSSKHTNAAC